MLFLCGCEHYPESYPPPAQFAGGRPNPEVMVDFGEPGAAGHIVKDIVPFVHGSWVWTGKQPTLKILAVSTEGMKLQADFALWDDGFKQTGPVALTFKVNDRDLDTVRYDTPGLKHFEKAVPSGWLSSGLEATVSITADKVYTAADGKQFGFILSRIGFKP